MRKFGDVNFSVSTLGGHSSCVILKSTVSSYLLAKSVYISPLDIARCDVKVSVVNLVQIPPVYPTSLSEPVQLRPHRCSLGLTTS